jgi:hypothetical protein
LQSTNFCCRFLNRAALKTEGDVQSDGSIAKPWRICTIQQVEDLKTLIRIFPLWSSSIFLGTPIGIQASLTVLQALTIDRYLGPHFEIPAGSILVVVLISTAISLTLIDRFLCPMWQKLTGKSPTPLQRIGLGHVLNILSMAFSTSGIEAAQNSPSPPPPRPARFNSAHVGLVAVSTTSLGWPWRSISLPGASSVVLPRISCVAAKYIDGDDCIDYRDFFLSEHGCD